MPNITAITIDGNAWTIPGGTTYVYQESGHGKNQNNSQTVSTILQDSGAGDGRISGNSMCDPLPNKAKNNQGCYHTHDQSGHQIFFNWAWTSSTSTLAIKTVTLKHG